MSRMSLNLPSFRGSSSWGESPMRQGAGRCSTGRLSMSSESTPNYTIQRKRSVKFAATLLDNLLNEGERAQECEEGDLEGTARQSAAMTSYKRFGVAAAAGAAKGRKKFRLCVKRNPFYQDDGFRLVDRDGPFFQSEGKWAISNVATIKKAGDGEPGAEEQSGHDTRSGLDALFLSDLYHTFLDAKLSVQLLFFAGIYMSCFCFFALAYLWSADDCGLKLQKSFIRAYMLSVETMITIGYGVSDPYMRGCWEAPVIITSQSLLQMLISASLIGVIFQGLSRPQSRANTVLFSNKAVIRTIDGASYLMLRICDLRFQHALIESHVRCYCVHAHPDRGFVMEPMRLQQPDDSLGGSLVPTLPTMIVHRLDAWSPLVPQWRCIGRSRSFSSERERVSLESIDSEEATVPGSAPAQTEESREPPVDVPKSRLAPPGVVGEGIGERGRPGAVPLAPPPHSHRQPPASGPSAALQPPMRRPEWPAVAQRQVDADTGNRVSCVCPTCGAEFGTAELLRRHCSYTAAADAASNLPMEVRHRPLAPGDVPLSVAHSDPTPEDIKDHLSEGYFEIVVLVEGVEPTTASTLQARHSYLVGGLGEDVVWDGDFAECVSMRSSSKGARRLALDLGKFHELVERPSDAGEP